MWLITPVVFFRFFTEVRETYFDLQEEVIGVPVAIGHALDHFDLVIDAFKQTNTPVACKPVVVLDTRALSSPIRSPSGSDGGVLQIVPGAGPSAWSTKRR